MIKLFLIQVLPPFVLPDFRPELGMLEEFKMMERMWISVVEHINLATSTSSHSCLQDETRVVLFFPIR